MPKGPQGQNPPKSKKQPEKPGSRTIALKRQATEQDVGDTADKITRALGNKR